MAALANKICSRFYICKRIDYVNRSNQIRIQVEMGGLGVVASSFVASGVFRASSVTNLSNHWLARFGFGDITLAKTEPVAICRISYVCGRSFLGSQGNGAVPLGHPTSRRSKILCA